MSTNSMPWVIEHFSETYFPGNSGLTVATSEIYCQVQQLIKIRKKYSTDFKHFYEPKEKKINSGIIKMLIQEFYLDP